MAARSVPSVEVVRSNDILELPELSFVVLEVHRLGVTSSESLSNPGVVESLSVSKALVSNSKSKSKSEHESREHSHVVSVEVNLTSSSEASIVGVRNGSTYTSEGKSRGTSNNVVHVVGVESIHVEVVGGVLDGVNPLDLTEHLLVSLLEVVSVVCEFRSVSTSHLIIFIINYNSTLN